MADESQSYKGFTLPYKRRVPLRHSIEHQLFKDIIDTIGIGLAVITDEGGFAVKLTSDAAITRGYSVYSVGTSDDLRVLHSAGDTDLPFGIAYNSTSGAGEEVIVVTSGIAYVYCLATGAVDPTRGNILYMSSTAGQLDHASVLPAVAKHNREHGHLIESRVGAGLVRAVIHFN